MAEYDTKPNRCNRAIGFVVLTVMRLQRRNFRLEALGWVLTSLLLGSAPHVAAREQQDASVTPTTGQMVSVGDHRLHVVVQGQGDVTVLFEAGGGADSTSWGTVPELLKLRGDVRVVTYDRAGLGKSDVGDLDLTPEDEIYHVRRVLEATGSPSPTLVVGHSWGGVLALRYAARFHDSTVGLVLVDPMNPIFVDAVGIDFLQQTVPEIEDPKSPREHVLHRMKRDASALIRATGEQLPKLQMPMTIISAGLAWWGSPEIDGAWRSSHERMASMADERRLVIAESSGHGIPQTQPEIIVGAIEDLLAVIRGSAAKSETP